MDSKFDELNASKGVGKYKLNLFNQRQIVLPYLQKCFLTYRIIHELFVYKILSYTTIYQHTGCSAINMEPLEFQWASYQC